ncbi:MAG: DUF1549 and DUF1553 domain-containing protein [Bryobacterales bacterium]|nr:DUF1549 and DUF1553 domain-containing protein [Bryobacterales bacterium]
MAAIGGAFQPGTRLLMIQAIRHRPVRWIAAFVLGLALGAPLPAAGADAYTRAQRDYWAFQPVQRSEAPPGGEWVRNPVDGFVLEALQAEGLGPAPEADRAALVRRAFLALVGLPPSPEEVREFVGDSSPDAYERLVERLLASPHYGERWGRHWLDLARFAESSGFERDVTRGNAWRYRDYVIAALNADTPYDRFVREQVAGDELWPDSFEARIATAFNRNYAEEGNQKDLLLARQETLHDITAVVGSTFLGLTYDCARCHDHKFDPITQKDYYRLQAFFANVNHDDRFPIVPAAELGEYRRKLAVWEERTAHIWEEMSDLLMPLRNYTPSELLARYPDFVIEAIKMPAGRRSPMQQWMASLLATKTCGTCPLRPKPHLDPVFRNVAGKLRGEDKARFEALDAELQKLAHLKPADIPRGTGITDVDADPPPTHVLSNGQYTGPLEEVEPGFLSILDPGPALVVPPDGGRSTGRRSALAGWLADPSNPLPARVMVNRIWHHHFGRGIVATPGDFGMMGERPSHPQLLDWLADEFVRSGWSIKRVHRLLMLSSTYRQATAPAPGSAPERARRADPFNKLLWRFPMRRLEGEVLRDSALRVAGLLNARVGGPSVFPPLPEGTPKPVGGWKTETRDSDHRRRSVYVFVRRNAPYPMLDVFDFPDSHESCAMRNRTTTASQALSLLNGAEPTEWARGLAARVHREAGIDPREQVEAAYRLAYSRRPSPAEKETAMAFFDRHAGIIAAALDQGGESPVPASVPQRVSEANAAALVDFCLMLLNSNEFAYGS